MQLWRKRRKKKEKVYRKKQGKRSESDCLAVQTRRQFALSRAFCCCQCWLGSRRECYCTPCNVRVCLAGWMRSAALGVTRVGGYFLEGSGQTIAFISCQRAQQNIQRKAKCAELELFGKGMFRLERSRTGGKANSHSRNSFRNFPEKKKKMFSSDLSLNRPLIKYSFFQSPATDNRLDKPFHWLAGLK